MKRMIEIPAEGLDGILIKRFDPAINEELWFFRVKLENGEVKDYEVALEDLMIQIVDSSVAIYDNPQDDTVGSLDYKSEYIETYKKTNS